jgi:hypothetical protein
MLFSVPPIGVFKMRHAVKSTIQRAAFLVTCLALSALPAKAEVFDFSFSKMSYGTFTTGAVGTDPGYELITGLTFALLSGRDEDAEHFSFTNVVALRLPRAPRSTRQSARS